jgi:hypothetical protein
VLGKYDEPGFYEPDSCNTIGGSCGCAFYEEAAPLALCIPVSEFPPERDCTFESRDCNAIVRALETVSAYRDGSAFFFPYDPPEDLAQSVEACEQKLLELLETTCV